MDFIDYLSSDDLIDIAQGLIPDLRIRDLGLLESASARPRMTVHGRDAYPTFSEKVAALMHSIARNGSLVDGNKRLAWGAGRVFCIMNRRDLIMNEFEAERLIHSISKGEIGVKAISELIKPLIRKI